MHRETLDLRKVLSHFEAQVSHFSTGTAALFGRRLQTEALVLLYMLANAFVCGFFACLLFGPEL